MALDVTGSATYRQSRVSYIVLYTTLNALYPFIIAQMQVGWLPERVSSLIKEDRSIPPSPFYQA